MQGIIEIKGKQYNAVPGRYLYVPKLDADLESTITAPVLFLQDGSNTKVGAPYLADVTIQAQVIAHVRDKKVIVFKKKRRKGYKVRNGHRQSYTKILLQSFS